MLKNMKFKTSAFNIAQLLETEKKTNCSCW